MTVEEIEAIVGGYHGDAFRILGPHSARRKGSQARWEVRAFLPQAESLEVVAAAERLGPHLSDTDLYLHTEGTLLEAWRTLGAHVIETEGVRGVRFAVWAPNAEAVSLTGEFNDWDTCRHPMRRRNGGIWEIFVP